MPPRSGVPTLTDGVVTLRGHRESDVEGALEQCVDPLSQRWTTVPVPYTRDDAQRFVRDAMPGGWASDQEWGFAVEYDGRYAGTISLRNEGDGRAEIAFGSHPGVRGKGVMERALRLLLEWGFGPTGSGGRELQTVVWWANTGNWASRKLVWRLGFDIAPGVVRQWLPHRGELRDAWVGTLRRDDPREPGSRWLEAPVIRGEQVALRPVAEKDVPRIVEACSDPVSRHWLRRMPDPYRSEDAVTWLEATRDRAARGSTVTWTIADPGTDLMLGTVNLFNLDFEDGDAEVGYWVHPAARGRGVATAGTRAATRHGLVAAEDGGLGLARVHAIAAFENAGSRGALLGAGMREIGVERSAMQIAGVPMDAVRYDLLATDLP